MTVANNTSPQDPAFSANSQPDSERLWALVYDELRKVAYSKMSNESATLTLQPTALVHEAWIRLGGENQPPWANRAQFFSAAAEAMRRILIERARRRQAIRHGGDQHRIDIDDLEGLPASMNDDKHMIDLSDALDKLAQEDPQKAELVKYRYFVGMTIEETAKTMGVSTPTVWRWWEYARAWLHKEMNKE
ncbi:MAG: ECF-type sigma factor [Verrucomicrobia bacterium]|nr:ECF-type sigma factor [Verrucomicrobiota bacterium]